MVNVVVSGSSGLIFWVVAAQGPTASAISEASVLVAAMLGVLQITQQMLSANVPIMVTASPSMRFTSA